MGLSLWQNAWTTSYGDDPMKSTLPSELSGLTVYQIKTGMNAAAEMPKYEDFPPKPKALARICREQSRYEGFPDARALFRMCQKYKYSEIAKTHPAVLWLLRHAGSECKKYNQADDKSRPFFDAHYRALMDFLAAGGKLPTVETAKQIEDKQLPRWTTPSKYAEIEQKLCGKTQEEQFALLKQMMRIA